MVRISRKSQDLVGRQFNNWIVLKECEHRNKYGKRLWLCECQCPNKTLREITTGDLLRGKPKSCGCLNTTLRLKALRENSLNKYMFTENECIIIANNTGHEFYIDIEDYEKIKNYPWYETQRGYLATSINKKTIFLHQFIMGTVNSTEKNIVVDHIYHDSNGLNGYYDNRKSSLRITTQMNNTFNRTISSSNTSGKKGVSWSKSEGKWKAYISYNHKRIHLGTFIKYEDAVKAREEAEDKYFGEYQYKEI